MSREDDTTSKLSLFLDLLVDIIKKQFSFKCKNLINLVSEATDTFDYDIPISYDEFSIWFRNHLQIHKLNEVENKYLKQENKELNNQIAEVNDRVRNETVKLNLKIKEIKAKCRQKLELYSQQIKELKNQLAQVDSMPTLREMEVRNNKIVRENMDEIEMLHIENRRLREENSKLINKIANQRAIVVSEESESGTHVIKKLRHLNEDLYALNQGIRKERRKRQ